LENTCMSLATNHESTVLDELLLRSLRIHDFIDLPEIYGHTLFDYDVGLNDIVQLLIRSESEAPTTSVTNQGGEVNPCAVSNCKNKVKRAASSRSPNQPSTSAHLFLIDPGIGFFLS
uniref:Uncharacterized protein n=1 Tax=Accipiter nisus TaxID=211598 RepID=A0A8B9RUK4_9AVES